MTPPISDTSRRLCGRSRQAPGLEGWRRRLERPALTPEQLQRVVAAKQTGSSRQPSAPQIYGVALAAWATRKDTPPATKNFDA